MALIRKLFYLTGSIGLFLAVSCVPSKNLKTNALDSPSPIGLLLEKQITGQILGKNLSRPHGIISDDAGNWYLVDADNNRIIRFNSDFEPVRDAAGYGSGDGLLNDPTYLALDNNLSLYISDAGNQRLVIFDSRLNYVDQISLIDNDEPLKFGRPSGLRVSNYGELWVGDYDRGQISIFNNVWQFERFIGGVESTAGLLLNPAGITGYGENNVLICDAGNSVVKIFDEIGIIRGQLGYGDLQYPSGVAVDSKNNIWIIDRDIPRLFCYGQSGKLKFTYGEFGGEGANFLNKPSDITILPDNRLAVTDSGNDRVLIFNILYP